MLERPNNLVTKVEKHPQNQVNVQRKVLFTAALVVQSGVIIDKHELCHKPAEANTSTHTFQTTQLHSFKSVLP